MNITLSPTTSPDIDVVVSQAPVIGVVTTPQVSLDVVGLPGEPGPPGPPGPPGADATQIVAISFDEWPPVSPTPNTLYLRLAE
jgi:hypothetical protein